MSTVVTVQPRGLTTQSAGWSVSSFPRGLSRLLGRHGRSGAGVAPDLRARVRVRRREVVAQDKVKDNIAVKNRENVQGESAYKGYVEHINFREACKQGWRNVDVSEQK